MEDRRLIGTIVPSSGIVTETFFHRFAPPQIDVCTGRVHFNQITQQGLSDMLNRVAVAAKDLSFAQPDVIVFSSVLAGAISGMTVANIVEKSTGVPCITGFLAMIRAIRALGIQRPVAISPFPDELDLIFKRKLQQKGIDLEASYRLATEGENGEVSIRALEQISAETVLQAIRRADISRADGLILNTSSIRGLDQISSIEQEVHIPILVGDQVSLWGALREIGDMSNIPSLGRLFEV